MTKRNFISYVYYLDLSYFLYILNLLIIYIMRVVFLLEVTSASNFRCSFLLTRASAETEIYVLKETISHCGDDFVRGGLSEQHLTYRFTVFSSQLGMYIMQGLFIIPVDRLDIGPPP